MARLKSVAIKCVLADLRCPDCGTAGGMTEGGERVLLCGTCRAVFPIIDGRPVLISASNGLFDRKAYTTASSRSTYSSPSRDWFPSPSVNLSRSRVLRNLGRMLARLPATAVLVVGSGTQRHKIEAALAAGGACNLRLTCVDVDASADVDAFADAHCLPFREECFDAVVTTAVLEHVLRPEIVAAELARVLRTGGLLYSELPFIQQVHEGAYDFTRYTLSGHRRLLNRYRELESGLVAGPGTALVWTAEAFAGAFFASQRIARAARLGARLILFWIKYFDYLLIRSPAALDGASCTYFFGEKIEGTIPDSEIIAGYRGVRQVVHL